MCQCYFYPRSPCGERLTNLAGQQQTEQFLSTLSLRRATVDSDGKHPAKADFYPRSPCGERPVYLTNDDNGRAFLSTLSLRRATRY